MASIGYDGSVNEAEWSRLLRHVSEAAYRHVVFSGLDATVAGGRDVAMTGGVILQTGILSDLGEQMRKLERPDPLFADVRPVPKGTHWIEQRLVGQFAFSAWTRDGRLRHPRYLGLRDDKRPEEVARERP